MPFLISAHCHSHAQAPTSFRVETAGGQFFSPSSPSPHCHHPSPLPLSLPPFQPSTSLSTVRKSVICNFAADLEAESGENCPFPWRSGMGEWQGDRILSFAACTQEAAATPRGALDGAGWQRVPAPVPAALHLSPGFT